MYFAKLKSAVDLFDTVMVDEEKAELYVQADDYDVVGKIPDELLVDKDGYEEVYGIEPRAEGCPFRTWKYGIRYSYEKESWEGMKFSDCTVMEYTSETLTSFLCTYPDEEAGRDDLIDFEFCVGDVHFRFFGHRLHIDQRNPDYEIYDPAIIVTFPAEKTVKDKICYIHSIDNMLRLVFFRKKISRPRIKFTRADLQDERYLSFQIYDKQRYAPAETSHNREGYRNRLRYIADDLPTIMTYLLENEINVEYFAFYFMLEKFQRQKLFSDTYFVFDKLANKAYGKAEEQNADFEAFKKRIWEEVEKSPEYENVKHSLSNLKDKIMSHGRERGHKEKLRKAMEEIFSLIPNRIRMYEPDFDLDASVKRIYRLRTDIVHNGSLINFEDNEYFAGEELQWLTYAMQLRQTGLPDDKLENWLDYAFGVG